MSVFVPFFSGEMFSVLLLKKSEKEKNENFCMTHGEKDEWVLGCSRASPSLLDQLKLA